MLRYDTPADAPNERPVRKLFVLVLLLVLRDGGRAVRFRCSPDTIDLDAELDGTWIAYVPPPLHIWPDLVAEVRRVARLVRPDRGGWWNRTRPDDPETGWLTLRLHGRDEVFRVHLDARSLLLERVGESVPVPQAGAALRGLVRFFGNGESLAEFPKPGSPAC